MTNCIFGVYVRPFNSSLRKHFNSIFLSTVMTLFNYFEIGPLLKNPQDKYVFVSKSMLVFIIEGLTNHSLFIVIAVAILYLLPPIYRTRVSLLYVIMKLLMTYHRFFNKSNTMGATCGAGTVYPFRAQHLSSPPVFSGFVLLDH